MHTIKKEEKSQMNNQNYYFKNLRGKKTNKNTQNKQSEGRQNEVKNRNERNLKQKNNRKSIKQKSWLLVKVNIDETLVRLMKKKGEKHNLPVLGVKQ